MFSRRPATGGIGLHEGRDHRRKLEAREQFAALIEELLAPAGVVGQHGENSAWVATWTLHLLKTLVGPNRFAYHGATLQNTRQPRPSPNTSTTKSRCQPIRDCEDAVRHEGSVSCRNC